MKPQLHLNMRSLSMFFVILETESPKKAFQIRLHKDIEHIVAFVRAL